MILTGQLPALRESAIFRYINFIALYLTEGLQMGMLFVGIPAWMAMQGKTPGEIGGFAVACALPWTFKFVVAPLMDRYTFLPMGRKRPWVLLGQVGLMGGLLVMAFVPDPLNNLHAFNIAAFIVSALGAMQDAATDGMAVDLIPADEQARANGFMGGARMIGSSLSLAAGSWLLNTYNFSVAIIALVLVIGLITLIPLLLRERPNEKLLPWTKGKVAPVNFRLQITSWKTIVKSLYEVFRLGNSLIISLLLFISQGAYNFFETLLPLFAVKVTGWTNVYYSQAFAMADLIGGISGMLFGGYLIEKFGKKRMIGIYFFLITFIVAMLCVLQSYWTNTPFLYGFIVVYRWLNAFAKIGVFAIAMQFCSKKVSASQFTFYMTIGAVGSLAGAALIGPIKNHFSWEITFLSFIIMLAGAWITLRFLNIERHVGQISQLESRDLEEVELELH